MLLSTSDFGSSHPDIHDPIRLGTSAEKIAMNMVPSPLFDGRLSSQRHDVELLLKRTFG
jgi:hypothetical protein